jgi:hypothetical protein
MAWWTKLPTLQTVQIVANAAVIATAVLAAWRIVTLGLLVGTSAAGTLCSWFTGGLVLWLYSVLTVSPAGQLLQNFFFHQSVGTAVSLLALTVLQAFVIQGGRISVLAFIGVPAVVWGLANIHTAPALWFAGAACICALSIDSTWRIRIGLSVAVGVASVLILLADPSVRAMMKVGASGAGDLNVLIPYLRPTYIQLSRQPFVLFGGLCLLTMLLGALVAVLWRKSGPLATVRSVLLLHAGSIAVLGVGALVGAQAVIAGGEGYYPLAKYTYLFVVESALVCAHLVAVLVPQRSIRYLPAGIAVIGISVVTLPWLGTTGRDQAPLIAYRTGLLQNPRSEHRLPLSEQFYPHERFYLAISALRYPRDEPGVWRLLVDPKFGNEVAAGSQVIPPSRLNTLLPSWDGSIIQLSDPGAAGRAIFFGRWWPAAKFGRWMSPPAAHLALRTSPIFRDKFLCVSLIAPPLRPGETIKHTIMVNGEIRATELFQADRRNRVANVRLDTITDAGDLVLTFVPEVSPTDAYPGGELAASGVSSLWIAPSC